MFRHAVIGLIGLVLALAACYAPTYQEGIACSAAGECPDGMTCAADHTCRRTAPDAAAGDIDAAPIDAAPPDAAPVACTGDDDCATPPAPCLQPGTCDAARHTCTFPVVDCSSLDGECTRGVCDPVQGGCVAQPAHEDDSCGAGSSCGPYSTCGGYADACDETGEQTRTCTSNTCRAGACVGTTTPETTACMRDTDGAGCGDSTVTGCSSCGGFDGACDESGTMTCTCTSFACAAGACAPSASSCAQACSRNTDGQPCGAGGECTAGSCEHCPTC